MIKVAFTITGNLNLRNHPNDLALYRKLFLNCLSRTNVIFFSISILLFSNNRLLADNLNQDDPQQTLSKLSRHGQTMVISINGKISRPLLDRIRENTQALSPENRFPPSLLVTLDSLGGDADAAIEIGKILRKYNAHVFVTNRCGSACVFIYVGGALRASIPRAIGIHSPYITYKSNSVESLKEIGIDKNEFEKNRLMIFDHKANDYFNSMGIPNSFYDSIRSLNTKELYWLEDKEIEKYQISGLSPESVDAVSRDLMGKFNITLNKDKVISNSQHVLQECVYFKNEPNNFLKCYIRVMTTF